MATSTDRVARAWSVQGCITDPSVYQLLDETGKVIGFPRCGTGGREEKNELEANARLIASAPELLANLEFAVKLLQPLLGATAQVQHMRAVIKKAKGE